MIRYFRNKKTDQIIQIKNVLVDKPFDDDWIEIGGAEFFRLLSEQEAANKENPS